MRYGARLEHKNAFGKTPLHMAVEAGKQMAATFLLGHIKKLEANAKEVDASCCSGKAAPLVSRINYFGMSSLQPVAFISASPAIY